MALKVNNKPNTQTIGLRGNSLPIYVAPQNPQQQVDYQSAQAFNPQRPGDNVQPWRYGQQYLGKNIQDPIRPLINEAGFETMTVPINPHILSSWQYFAGRIPQRLPKMIQTQRLPLPLLGAIR